MTSTDVATRDDRPPIVVLRDRLETRKTELQRMLGNDIPADNFIRAVITSATLNPEIQACRWQTVWDACVRACRDGLLPDGVDAAIVPFKDRATYIAMYQGMLRRFRRSGQFKWITANVVRTGEEFVHFIDETGEHFRHVPGDNFSAQITKVYALATTKDGGVFVAVLSIAEANKIKNMSRAQRDDSPWKLWPEEMYKKLAIRRLSKYLPSARDLLPDDEDLPEIDSAPSAPELPATEQSASAPTVPAEAAPESGGEQGMSPAATENDSAARMSSSEEPRPDESRPAAADELKAYERGKQAKAAGHQKKAMPPEYRDSTHTRHALCWSAGYDDKPMPTFGG
jgi:recombination protein RecT